MKRQTKGNDVIRQPKVVWPGTARLTFAVVIVAVAVLAYPWRSVYDRWVLGIAVAAVIIVLGWWRGRHLTTLLGRRLALLGRNQVVPEEPPAVVVSACDARTTAVLSVTSDRPGDELQLPLLAGYLNRYGVRADNIRVTRREASGATGERQYVTWVGLTMSAADNLAPLLARSRELPLRETAQVAIRRLADHLREIGWTVGTSGERDIPALVGEGAREKWRAVADDSGYLAAYRITADEALTGLANCPAREMWTVLELSGHDGEPVLTAGCALRTDEMPTGAAPVAGLSPLGGQHRRALAALHPLSTERLSAVTGKG